MANYDNIRGAGYQRWGLDEDEPAVSQEDAKIEEMYFENHGGVVEVSMITEDGLIRVSIPVKASKDWNKFVDSLPKWD